MNSNPKNKKLSDSNPPGVCNLHIEYSDTPWTIQYGASEIFKEESDVLPILDQTTSTPNIKSKKRHSGILKNSRPFRPHNRPTLPKYPPPLPGRPASPHARSDREDLLHTSRTISLNTDITDVTRFRPNSRVYFNQAIYRPGSSTSKATGNSLRRSVTVDDPRDSMYAAIQHQHDMNQDIMEAEELGLQPDSPKTLRQLSNTPIPTFLPRPSFESYDQSVANCDLKTVAQCSPLFTRKNMKTRAKSLDVLQDEYENLHKQNQMQQKTNTRTQSFYQNPTQRLAKHLHLIPDDLYPDSHRPDSVVEPISMLSGQTNETNMIKHSIAKNLGLQTYDISPLSPVLSNVESPFGTLTRKRSPVETYIPLELSTASKSLHLNTAASKSLIRPLSKIELSKDDFFHELDRLGREIDLNHYTNSRKISIEPPTLSTVLPTSRKISKDQSVFSSRSRSSVSKSPIPVQSVIQHNYSNVIGGTTVKNFRFPDILEVEKKLKEEEKAKIQKFSKDSEMDTLEMSSSQKTQTVSKTAEASQPHPSKNYSKLTRIKSLSQLKINTLPNLDKFIHMTKSHQKLSKSASKEAIAKQLQHKQHNSGVELVKVTTKLRSYDSLTEHDLQESRRNNETENLYPNATLTLINKNKPRKEKIIDKSAGTLNSKSTSTVDSISTSVVNSNSQPTTQKITAPETSCSTTACSVVATNSHLYQKHKNNNIKKSISCMTSNSNKNKTQYKMGFLIKCTSKRSVNVVENNTKNKTSSSRSVSKIDSTDGIRSRYNSQEGLLN